MIDADDRPRDAEHAARDRLPAARELRRGRGGRVPSRRLRRTAIRSQAPAAGARAGNHRGALLARLPRSAVRRRGARLPRPGGAARPTCRRMGCRRSSDHDAARRAQRAPRRTGGRRRFQLAGDDRRVCDRRLRGVRSRGYARTSLGREPRAPGSVPPRRRATRGPALGQSRHRPHGLHPGERPRRGRHDLGSHRLGRDALGATGCSTWQRSCTTRAARPRRSSDVVERIGREGLSVYLAHMAIRQSDWSLRHHGLAAGDETVDYSLAFARRFP